MHNDSISFWEAEVEEMSSFLLTFSGGCYGAGRIHYPRLIKTKR